MSWREIAKPLIEPRSVSGSPSVVSEATAEEKSVASESGAVAFDTTTWRKPLAFAAGAELLMGF
jgi:hypothetical protein